MNGREFSREEVALLIGVPLAWAILLVLAAVPIGWHVTPFGQFGLVLFAVAVLLVVRGRPATALGDVALRAPSPR